MIPDIKVGHGYDVHRLDAGRKLIIGGVDIPYEYGLLGHSDADVLVHAVLDALIGAMGLGDIGKLPVSSRYLRGSDVYVGDNSLLLDALHRGGAVVVRLYYEVAHYVLFTGVKDGQILLFDPYYQTVPFTKPDEKEALLVTDHPFSWNRSVPFSYFNRESMELYALGEMAGREAVLLFNRNTVLTEEATIEYFI